MFGIRKATKEFCATLREISDENSRLKSENERLKKAAERDADVLESLNLSLEESQAENTKLRELVIDIWRFTGTACKKYPRLFDPAAQGGQMVRLNMIDAFEQHMRELGIEVDK